MDAEAIRELVKRHEGFRGHPYMDSTGNTTIGYGRNLDANPLTPDEAELLLENDLNRAWDACMEKIPGFGELDKARKAVLIDMTFNMGIAGLLNFRKMLTALWVRNYRVAAEEMLNSTWAVQVGSRAQELGRIMRTGVLDGS
jgi:lysozyme